MKCEQICEWNNWGLTRRCFRPTGEQCPMVMTVEEFDQQANADACHAGVSALSDGMMCGKVHDGMVAASKEAATKAQETYEKIMSQKAKADGGKLQIHMVPMQIVRDIAEVRMYGTRKYGDENNWRKVELMRYVDAMLRHTLAFVEDIYGVDEESGIPHYKHAECNWSFISQLMHEGKCPPKRERNVCKLGGKANDEAGR